MRTVVVAVVAVVAAGIAAVELAACDASSPSLVARASDAGAGAVERDAGTDADGGAIDCPPPRQLSGSYCGCPTGDLFCAPLNVCFSMRSLLPAGAGGCGPCSIACPPDQLCVQKDFEPPYGTCHETCGGSRESILCPVDGSVACVNLAQDSANCGACAHACPAGQHCMSAHGTCAPD